MPVFLYEELRTTYMKSLIMKKSLQCKFKALCLVIFIAIAICVFRERFEEKTNVCKDFCLLDNIITVREGGRLGNFVWEYFSVMGLQEALGFCPYMPRKILNSLGSVFQNLKIPAYEDTLLSDYCRVLHEGDVKNCKSKILSQNGTAWDRLCYALTNGASITSAVGHKPIAELIDLNDSGKLPSILILPQWIAQTDAFSRFGISRFKQEFQFRGDVKELAVLTLKGVTEKVGGQSDLIFVGVHVRRTDYKNYLREHFGKNLVYADLSYYKRAMSRMHDLYADSRIVFVVVGDDRKWCMDNLVNEEEGVLWGGLEGSSFIHQEWKDPNKLGAAHDLAVLAMTNHSIIGYGTFGITGSLLAGGHTIACNISRDGEIERHLNVRFTKILPNWELL